MPNLANPGWGFSDGNVSADKTSVVSADKTSVVSADKTSVVSQDIPTPLPTRPRCGRLRKAVGMSWETTNVLSADRADVLASDTTDVVPADTTHVVPSDKGEGKGSGSLGEWAGEGNASVPDSTKKTRE